MNQIKKCPKCNGEMAGDRHIGYYTELTLKKGDEFIGERINALYCKNCGYIELYKEMKEKKE
jgi:predicted nucleic-acid-binding Zn-ribbon protein